MKYETEEKIVETVRSTEAAVPKLKEAQIAFLSNSLQQPFISSLAEDHTNSFLSMFPGDKTFLTFDDKKKTKSMNMVFYGNTVSNMNKMKEFNKKGAGVFLIINETDGKGVKPKNITKVRAVFVDVKASKIEQVLEYNPHMVIESSPGRYQAYWLVKDVPLNGFAKIQKSIARKFNCKKPVTDLAHAMRVPGFL